LCTGVGASLRSSYSERRTSRGRRLPEDAAPAAGKHPDHPARPARLSWEADAHPDRARTEERPSLLNSVQLVIDDAGRWLVAPYGEREWVKNARVAGEVDLMRAGRTRRHRIEELGPDEAAPVLREYLRTTSIVRPYFDADADAPLKAFAAEADSHPVFRLLDEPNR
jgi:hypothetical protein